MKKTLLTICTVAAMVIAPQTMMADDEVYNYTAAGCYQETFNKLNTSGFYVNMGAQGKLERNPNNFKGYKGYEGTNCPAVCHTFWGDQLRVDTEGLVIDQDGRYFAIDSLAIGDKITVTYSNVPEGKEVVYASSIKAVRNGLAFEANGAALVSDTATVDDVLTFTNTPIASGDEITVTGLATGINDEADSVKQNAFCFSVHKGMRIQKVVYVHNGETLTYDFLAAGNMSEKLTKLNTNGFQVNMTTGKEDRTDRNFKGYRDYTGTNLPAECHVFIGEQQNLDAKGLIVTQDRYLAVSGLAKGDTVVVDYIDCPEDTAVYFRPGTSVNTAAAIDGVALVSGESVIPSGAKIAITAAGDKDYIVMNVYKGMHISKVTIMHAPEQAYHSPEIPDTAYWETVLGPDMLTQKEKTTTTTTTAEDGTETTSESVVMKYAINDTTYPWIVYTNPTSAVDDGTAEVQTSDRWTDLNPTTAEAGTWLQATGADGSVNSPVVSSQWGKYISFFVTGAAKFRVFATGSAKGSEADGNQILVQVVNGTDTTTVEGTGGVYGKSTKSDTCAVSLDASKKYEIIVSHTVAGKDIQITGINLWTAESLQQESLTGITEVNVAPEQKSARRYNLSGQLVDNSYKGVVIMNGKKYILK